MLKKSCLIALSRAAIILSALLVVPPATLAQQQAMSSGRESDWDIMLGAGFGRLPHYDGSDEYYVGPVPYVRIRWKDIITYGPEGLEIKLLRLGEFEAGVGLGVDPGRDEASNTLFVENDDQSLQGIGDIDIAPGVRAYMEYDFKYVSVNTGVIRYFAGGNEGTLIDLTFSKSIPLNERWTIIPSIKTTWGNSVYMSSFYGVSPRQSAASMFPIFPAEAGFKDVSFTLSALRALSQHWFIFMSGQVKKLVDDAANSPITRKDTNTVVMSGIGYRWY